MAYHKEHFGENFEYKDFAEIFNEKIKEWQPDEWAKLFTQIGAKYVVLGTKHHDGFLLWPSAISNPHNKGFHASRNIVGELTEAVRNEGLKMGYYYSGGLDWTFEKAAIRDVTTMLSNAPRTKHYATYVDLHFQELMTKFEPDILWNDICYPIEGNLYKIIAQFYNMNPEGVINDRWHQIPKIARHLKNTRIIKWLINKLAARQTKKHGFAAGAPKFGDFSTPEYQPNAKLRSHKWEACRGIGRSFGFNQMETVEHYLSAEELIHSFIDIVSKNGNLLLNVGPTAEGKIPEIQKERLIALGNWIEANKEGIFGTRPWKRAEAFTDDGLPVRFTQKGDNVYAFILGVPKTTTLKIPKVAQFSIKDSLVLGLNESISTKWEGKTLILDLPPLNETSLKHAVGVRFQQKKD